MSETFKAPSPDSGGIIQNFDDIYFFANSSFARMFLA